jgi:uncharacterized membrane protein
MTLLKNDIRGQGAVLVLIAVATGVAFWIGEGVEAAIAPFVLLLAFAAVVVFGQARSDAIRAMSGVGDERTRSLYERAVGVAGTVVSVAVPTWWLVTVARGEPNDTLAAVAAIFGVAFVVASVVLSRRG